MGALLYKKVTQITLVSIAELAMLLAITTTFGFRE